MANQIGDTVSKGNYFNVCTDETNKTFETKSFYTDSEDVSFADGENAENKVGAIKGITSDFNTTDAGYAASMTAVSKLNSSLVSDIYVGNDGNLHKVVGGADTVLPFNNLINGIIKRGVNNGGTGSTYQNFGAIVGKRYLLFAIRQDEAAYISGGAVVENLFVNNAQNVKRNLMTYIAIVRATSTTISMAGSMNVCYYIPLD